MDGRDLGPVIPNPAGMDTLRSAEDKIAEAKIRAATRRIARRDPATLLPHDPGKLDEEARRVFEDTRKFVTEAGARTIDVVRSRPDGPKMRKLAAFSEEYKRGIEKYAEGLKQSQTEWQKEAGKFIEDILKVGDNAVELYEAFQEYPFSDNFKDYGADKAKAANKRDYNIALLNQAISLYYWSNLKDIDKSKIIDKLEFKEAQHSIDTLKAKMRDRSNMYRDAVEYKRQCELFEFQIANSQKRESEGAAHSASIQDLPDGIGIDAYLRRLLKAGNVKRYSEQGEERAKELESVLAHVEKHRQETEAKIGAYLSHVQKRSNAFNDLLRRQNTVNRIFGESITRSNDAITRITAITGRATRTPIVHSECKNLADAIIANGIGAAGDAIDIQIRDTINDMKRVAKRARARNRRARARAEEAATRAEEAATRAKEAATRVRIAEAYNRNNITAQAAKNVEKCAKAIERLEKEVNKNNSLIEECNINIDAKSKYLIENLRLMQRIRIGRTLTDADRRKLAEAAEIIEEAEANKSSAIAFEAQATTAEQTSLNNISRWLHNEHLSLTNENVTETAITNLANQDLTHLQNLVVHQRALEENLRGIPAVGIVGYPGYVPAVAGLIERERQESQAAQAIERAIRNRVNIGGHKAVEQTCRQAVHDRRTAALTGFEARLRQVMNTERAAAEALKRNAIHMELDVTGDADQAIEHLQKIKDDLADQNDEGLKKLSKGHLFIDPKAGKFTLGDQAVWMWVREINGWGRPDYATVPTGQTLAEYRPDIVKIEIETVTREAGKLSVEPIDTKRLERRYFRSADYEYTLEVPGDTFAGGGRRQATLTIIDLKKRDGRTLKSTDLQALTGPTWTAAEYTTPQTIDMEAAGTIRIKENHNNQNHPVEILVSFETQVMPDPLIDHAQALARRQGEGWSDKQKQHMWKIDLDRHVLSFPNGLEFSLDDFDWTETRWDEENGLTLRFKGPGKLFELNLLAAGSYDAFDPRLSDFISSLKKRQRKHQETGIEWLKQSIRSYDEKKIDTALTSIKSTEGIMSYQSSVVQDELQKPPKNRLDLEKLRKKKKAQKDTWIPRWVATSLEGTADMLLARQSYESKVKELIQTIHKKNPLSAEYVWKSRARPDIYRIEKHTSSQKKLWLLNEIRAANHLDKTVSFPLLEDPKQGPASVVKNAKPNGLELLREYNLYKNKQDFANQTERQNVEHYVASIETLFMTDANIDPYYTNQWNFERAMEAVTRGEILSKVVDGRNIIGASEYIRNLKQVDCPLTPDDSIASLRQADEYHWVTYLRSELAKASAENLAEVLQKSLPVALWMQKSRYNNLKLAEKALDLETTSDEAKWFIEDIDIVETPLPWSEPETDQKAKVDTTKDKNQFDPKTRADKSEAELAQEASERAEQIYKHATDAVDRLIESTDDPALQKKYREEAVKMAMDMAKQAFEINKQDKAIQDQWRKLEVYIKEVNTQRWKDLVKEMALLWLKASVEGAGKGVQNFMNELEKIVMKMAS